MRIPAMILSCAVLFASPLFAGQAVYAPDSLYRLEVDLHGHNGAQGSLDLNAGHYTLVTMFYGSCPHVCPMIISTMQEAEKQLEDEQRARLRVLMVSLDSKRDTPESLATVAGERHVDSSRWTLASASAMDVRKVAAVLGIRFRELPDGAFNHTSEMILLDPTGREVIRSDKLGKPAVEFVDALRTATSGL